MTEVYKGLIGVTVDETAISKVNAETNSLLYRGYPVQDLAMQKSFEEVAYLLWSGELPTVAQYSDFVQKEREARGLTESMKAIIRSFSADSHPMDWLRTAISFLGMEDKKGWTQDPKRIQEISLNLWAKIPTIIATAYRNQKGLSSIEPDQSLAFSENFFYMMNGRVPEEKIIKAFDISMTLYAEHSFNASTFTSRVIASSLSDIYGAVVGAIASLKGPLHGGANEAVMHNLLEIGEPERAEQWLRNKIKHKELVMGFGHRVYKKGDSRVPTMTQAYHDVALLCEGQKWVEISKILERIMVTEKNIYPNLDFPAGPTYFLMGFDVELFTPLFVMSRITGWTAHIHEQWQDNKLIRPLSLYTGKAQREI